MNFWGMPFDRTANAFRQSVNSVRCRWWFFNRVSRTVTAGSALGSVSQSGSQRMSSVNRTINTEKEKQNIGELGGAFVVKHFLGTITNVKNVVSRRKRSEENRTYIISNRSEPLTSHKMLTNSRTWSRYVAHVTDWQKQERLRLRALNSKAICRR